MSVQLTSDYNGKITRRIVIVGDQALCLSKHCQERFVLRDCGRGRSIESGLERLDGKLKKANLTTRRPAWIPAQTDITLWLVLDGKSAMLCEIEDSGIVAVTFENRKLLSADERDERAVRVRRKMQLEMDHINSMEDWSLTTPEAANER